MINIEIDGIRVACTTFDYVLSEMDRAITQYSTNNYICITNTESMFHATRLKEHLSYINNANFSLCDGIGSVIAGMAFGYKIPRLNGPILMLNACNYGINRGWRHFFYGGGEGIADLMAKNLKKKYPGLIIAGTYAPPFRQLTLNEEEKVINLIQESKADIVWVGLGLLKQEKWIASHLKKIQVPWMIGVGGAFDYHSGNISWAPKWLQTIGMEWLYRLALQPRLRIKRYYWSFIFMFQAIYKGLKLRLSKLIHKK